MEKKGRKKGKEGKSGHALSGELGISNFKRVLRGNGVRVDVKYKLIRA